MTRELARMGTYTQAISAPQAAYAAPDGSLLARVTIGATDSSDQRVVWARWSAAELRENVTAWHERPAIGNEAPPRVQLNYDGFEHDDARGPSYCDTSPMADSADASNGGVVALENIGNNARFDVVQTVDGGRVQFNLSPAGVQLRRWWGYASQAVLTIPALAGDIVTSPWQLFAGYVHQRGGG